MSFNIKQIPFSRYGSYLSISYLKNQRKLGEGIYFRNIRGGDEHDGAVFKLDLTYEGEVVPYKCILNKTNLTLESPNGYVKFVFPEDDYAHFYGEKVGLRLTLVAGPYDNAQYHKDNQWHVNVFTKKIRFMLTPFQGEMKIDTKWNINRSDYVNVDFIPENDKVEGVIEEFITTYKPKDKYYSIEESEERVKEELTTWSENAPSVPKQYDHGKDLATYITWSSIVKSEGELTRPSMYMSKNWMTNIWSWDNCFNAMALVNNDVDLAWDQLMVFFDIQDESGQLPDFVNDQFAYWNCSKPPIHGWTINWMLNRTNKINEGKLKEIYEPLKKWTEWYYNHRDVNKNGFPEYHHGNDSGWDNSTIFHQGVPVESPDLSSFLVLQMEALSDIAKMLNKNEEANFWKKKSEQLIEDLIEYFWDGEKFVAKHLGENVTTGDSLILFMPIILGNRLPNHIKSKLIEGLKESNRFLTENGLATESISSEYYIDDGYWQGPIWAPSTMLLIDGLKRAGEEEFAKELARKYCNMALKNGMAENYNAKTGEGLRDRAFTWTSSVFLILANEYLLD